MYKILVQSPESWGQLKLFEIVCLPLAYDPYFSKSYILSEDRQPIMPLDVFGIDFKIVQLVLAESGFDVPLVSTFYLY